VIPRRVFWGLDLIAIGIAFALAYLAARRIYNAAAPVVGPQLGSLLPAELTRALPYPWYLPPVTELLWILPTFAIVALITLSVCGNYRPLLDQSYTRILLGSVAASVVGLGLIALVLLAFRSADSNRLFLATFAGLTAAAFAGSRIIFRNYFRRRKAAGYYARSVLLIGEHEGLTWLVRYLSESTSPTEYVILGYLRVRPDQPPTME
jgi:FlaA1/EpsC-like NDP-sugar epimerase